MKLLAFLLSFAILWVLWMFIFEHPRSPFRFVGEAIDRFVDWHVRRSLTGHR